jgi:hypothetical protein
VCVCACVCACVRVWVCAREWKRRKGVGTGVGEGKGWGASVSGVVRPDKRGETREGEGEGRCWEGGGKEGIACGKGEWVSARMPRRAAGLPGCQASGLPGGWS